MLHYRIINNFEKEYTIYQLSLKYNIPESKLYNELEEYYTSKDEIKTFKKIIYNIENNKAKSNIKVIVQEFENGVGTRKLANKYHTTRYNIRQELERHYILLNNIKKYESIVKKNNKSEGTYKYTLTEEMKQDLDNGKSILQLSKEKGIPYTTLRRLITKEKEEK